MPHRSPDILHPPSISIYHCISVLQKSLKHKIAGPTATRYTNGMKPQNPNFKQEVERVFVSSPFIQHIGIVFEDCGAGWCRSSLLAAPRHRQHSGVVHGGVLATMADNTAGGAAYSLAPVGVNVLTIEFKINLLRPGLGERFICHGRVLKPGRRFTIVESEVFAYSEHSEKLVCKAMVTIGNI